MECSKLSSVKRITQILLLISTLFLTGSSSVKRPTVRAIWITRFDYKIPGDVIQIIVNCARTGFTDIFFQVRGNGTVFYPSRHEPWAWELSGPDVSALGNNPDWDPLSVAVAQARQQGVRLHAYINVLPGWRGLAAPPPADGQLWTAHPDWFMVDRLGARMQATSGWYTFLNPAHPDVRCHLAAIAAELGRYDIAGLHLDYIRFPYDYKDVAREIYPKASAAELRKRSDFSYDPVSQYWARKEHGSSVSRREWDDFRRESVTQVVRDLRGAVRKTARPPCIVSASVLADVDAGYGTAFQDSHRWAKEGIADWIIPMNYHAGKFDEQLCLMRRRLGRKMSARKLVVGINGANDPGELLRELREIEQADCRGFAFFAYSYLYDKNHRPTAKGLMLLRLNTN